MQLRYRQIDFDTELELRWAYLFDMLGIEWLYKPQTFSSPSMFDMEYDPESGALKTKDGVAPIEYTPTFYLPVMWTWVHVENEGDNTDWAEIADFLDWGCALDHFSESADSFDEGEREKLDELGVDTLCLRPGLLIVSTIRTRFIQSSDARSYFDQEHALPQFTFISHAKGLRRNDVYLLPYPYGIIFDHGLIELMPFYVQPASSQDWLDGSACDNKEAHDFFMCNETLNRIARGHNPISVALQAHDASANNDIWQVVLAYGELEKT